MEIQNRRLGRFLSRCNVVLWAIVCSALPAEAAIEISSVNEQASAYGYFFYTYDGGGTTYYAPVYNVTDQNNAVNDQAYVSEGYYGQPSYPTVSSYAQAGNQTDFETYLDVQGSASSYADPTSTYGYFALAQASGLSEVTFRISEQSTATLFLQAYAYSENPGYGYNQASASAGLFNVTTQATEVGLSAFSQNGQSLQNFANSYLVTLDPGVYRLAYESTYAYGYSYNFVGSSDAQQSAYARAYLYNIQPVAPAAVAAPEPPQAVVWATLSLMGLGGAFLRRRRSRATDHRHAV
jgi:hypothetical protein